MEDFVDRLERVAREHMLDAMPADPSGELEAMSLADLLISYGTWRSRLIPSQPRHCHFSNELQASPKATEHRTALDAIVAKVKAGDSLKPHLSKRVRHSHDPRPLGTGSLSGRADRDLMIADWGIHHLHLSTEEETNASGFVRRTADLLFAAFKPDDAYLIGIYGHLTDWARQDIPQTVVTNWPNAGIMLPTPVLGLERQFSDADRLELRNAGIANPMVEINGEVWTAAALGQSAAGTPSSATQRSNVVMHTLRDWREHSRERLADAVVAVNAAAGREVTGDWQPAIYEEWAGLQREDVFHGIAALS